MSELEGVIFDVDGTLADTEEWHRQAFNRAFKEFKLDWEWGVTEYAQLLAVSGGHERIFEYATRRQLRPDTSNERLRELAGEIHRRKSEIYRSLLVEDPPRLRCGVRRLLDEAHADGLSLAIATSSSLRNVEAMLTSCNACNLLEYFSAIVDAGEVNDKKPSPEAYRQAMIGMELPPAACLAIEDTEVGNAAARAAGLATIITPHAFTREHRFDGASLVVDRLGEPDQPFTILAGDAHGHRWVNLELLRTLRAAEKESGRLPKRTEKTGAISTDR